MGKKADHKSQDSTKMCIRDRAIALSEEARSLVKSVLEKTIDKGRALPREELLELYIERAGKIQDIMDEFKKVVDMIE